MTRVIGDESKITDKIDRLSDCCSGEIEITEMISTTTTDADVMSKCFFFQVCLRTGDISSTESVVEVRLHYRLKRREVSLLLNL